MGIRADSPAAVREALPQGQARHWRRPLEPVRVACAGGPIELVLSWPMAKARAPVAWVLEQKGGALHEGSLSPAALPVVATGRVGTRRYARYRFTLPVELPIGYHRLRIEGAEEGPGTEARLIVAPPACYSPEAIEDGGRVWGPGTLLPAVRSARNWGIGSATLRTSPGSASSGLGWAPA